MSVMASSNSTSAPKKRKHEDDTRPALKKSRTTSEDSASVSEDSSQENDHQKPTSKHTKKERKQNRSTRIHSLRKLLARGTIPSTIKQEKERELAALLHEQDKTKIKQEAKKTLEKYHYVRFVERQKAEKRLKQLRKQLQSERADESIAVQIHEMEVSRNYAIYAPLDRKYVSIFASKSKARKQDVKNSDPQDRPAPKPDMWYTIEKTMVQGQSALEGLRDGKTRVMPVSHDEGEQQEARPALKKNGEQKIRPQNASVRKSSNSNRDEGKRGGRMVEALSDDALSDGGFFEK